MVAIPHIHYTLLLVLSDSRYLEEWGLNGVGLSIRQGLLSGDRSTVLLGFPDFFATEGLPSGGHSHLLDDPKFLVPVQLLLDLLLPNSKGTFLSSTFGEVSKTHFVFVL